MHRLGHARDNQPTNHRRHDTQGRLSPLNTLEQVPHYPSPSLPLSPPFPSPALPSPLSSPPLPPPSLPIPLEVGPLIAAKGSGGAL